MLEADGVFRMAPAPLAPQPSIERVHDPEYVVQFLDGTLPPAAIRRIGFPWSPGLVKRTLASVGGTLSAGRDALVEGWSGTLAGGTHHAFRDRGGGFCVFNDIAVAVSELRAIGAIRRAAILDLDVHQGDGTAAIFADESDVLTVSMHGRNNFPLVKERSGIDIALPDGTGDDAYLCELMAVLPRVLAFEPGIIIYQAGVDGLASDRLGRLALTAQGLKEPDRLVFTALAGAGIPCAVTLGGGYSEPIDLSVAAHASTFRLAFDLLTK
jgi:acetoin utilization deacetylase AcuC-like enzyme